MSRSPANPLVLSVTMLCACSSLPDRVQPPFEDVEVEVRYAAPAGTAFRVPASGDKLTVLSLHTEPERVHERFEGAARILETRTGRLRVLCRYRLYGDPDDPRPPHVDPRELFPGAASLRVLRRRTRPSP